MKKFRSLFIAVIAILAVAFITIGSTYIDGYKVGSWDVINVTTLSATTANLTTVQNVTTLTATTANLTTVQNVTTFGAQDSTLSGKAMHSYENVTCTSDAGVAAVTKTTTFLTSENNATPDVVSLADGTAGQIKIIVFKTDSGDDVEITPTNFGGGTKVTMDTAGESAWFQFDGTNWQLISTHGGVVS